MSEYITTYTGKHFKPTEPDPELFDIADIAHALSLICRGNGHVKMFWPVGEHCICCAKEAKDNQEKAAELKAQYEAKLKDIDKEAEDILSDARRRALQNEERIVTQAKEEAARILARAQEEARLEKQKMSDEIKQEIVSVASVMAGKLVGASIDTTRQNSLIEETLKEMGEDTWQN